MRGPQDAPVQGTTEEHDLRFKLNTALLAAVLLPPATLSAKTYPHKEGKVEVTIDSSVVRLEE